MEISANLAAALGLLTEAMDDDARPSIVDGLQHLAAGAAAAVPSYLGLTVLQRDVTPPFTITAMEAGADPEDVRSSLLLPLPGDGSAPLAVILYAAVPGAFADVATDLTWVLGLPPSQLVVDQHLEPPPEPDPHRSLHVMSVINQAIGVLIGRGYRPEEADAELDARAARDGQSRYDAARIILSSLDGGRSQEA